MISLEEKIEGLESEIETVRASFAGCKAENAKLKEALSLSLRLMSVDAYEIAVTLLAKVDRLNETVAECARYGVEYEGKFHQAMSALHPFTTGGDIDHLFYEQAKTIYEELSK